MIQMLDRLRIPFMDLDEPGVSSRFTPPPFRLSGRGVF